LQTCRVTIILRPYKLWSYMSDGFAGSTTNTSEKLEKEVEARLAKADKQSKAKEGLMSSKRLEILKKLDQFIEERGTKKPASPNAAFDPHQTDPTRLKKLKKETKKDFGANKPRGRR
jgi:hypothetical protein